mgnify:CR=1 FL=1
MDIINHRSGLTRFRDAINNRDSVRIGYIGGSITQEAAKINWPEYVNAWIKKKAGNKIVYAENIGIGGTGSDIGVFRFEKELSDKDCDLIFVEFAVNDGDIEQTLRARSREGLVRKILKSTQADVVFVYTYRQEMLGDMIEGRVPQLIAEYEEVAEHYNIGSVWMAKAAFEKMSDGFMGFEKFLGDGLHPNQLGSYIYAGAVIEYLDRELKLTSAPLKRSIEPINKNNWENAKVIPFEELETDGAWYVRSLYNYDFRHTLYTSSLTSSVKIKCRCKTLVICRLYGKDCAMMKYRIDGGEWLSIQRDVVNWMGGANWPYQNVLIDEETEAEHTVEIMPQKAMRECGSSIYIAYVGVV